MGSIKKEQILQIEKYLDQQGLTFSPLRDEMLDHIIGDIEAHMAQGRSFSEALTAITNNIPQNHFKTLQQETMESINKRFNISRAFSYLSIGLLTVTSVFKLLHLQGTTILLFSSLLALVIALSVSTISGVYMYKEKKGVAIMLGTVIGIILFFFSWFFQTLQLPGSVPLKVISVSTLLVLFPLLTVYFNNNLKSETNILTYLHEKHTPGINRLLLILLLFASMLRITSMAFGYPPTISAVLLILIICAAGLQYFALTWHPQASTTSKWMQGAIILSFTCFILPTFGTTLVLPFRSVLASGFYLMAGLIIIFREQEPAKKSSSTLIVGFISTFHILWVLIQTNILPPSFTAVIFNLPFLIFLLSSLILARKQLLLRTYIVIVLAHYLLEYPNHLGLW